MTRSLYSQNSFVSGVLGPRLLGRTDINQYFQGLQQGDNVFILPQGGFRLAPGLEFVETNQELLLGGLSNVRMIEFSVSSTRRYLLVFTDEKLRIFRDKKFLVELPSQFVDSTVTEINSAQIDDRIVLLQSNTCFRMLIAPGDNEDDSDEDTCDFSNPNITAPKIDYDDFASPIPISNIQTITWDLFSEGDTYRLMIDVIITSDIVFSDNP